MTFSVKKAIADADLEPYSFEDADGEQQQLPHAKLLTPRQAFRVMVHGDLDGVLREAGVADVVVDSILDWPSHVVEQLLIEWFKHSDIEMPGGEPGKSPKSSPSSPNTATSSRRTSRSAASRSKG